MNCAKFESRLTDYMDGTLDGGLQQAMSEHLKECSSCSDLLARVHALRELLKAFPQIELRQALVDQILDRTTGKPPKWSVWSGFILPTIRPFLTQRYAFGTGILVVFISLVFTMVGPTPSTSGYSDMSPSSVAENADRLTDNVKKKWAQMRVYQTQLYEEARLLKEGLYGQLDSYVIKLLFRSYSQSVQEQQTPAENPDTSAGTDPKQPQTQPQQQPPQQPRRTSPESPGTKP